VRRPPLLRPSLPQGDRERVDGGSQRGRNAGGRAPPLHHRLGRDLRLAGDSRPDPGGVSGQVSHIFCGQKRLTNESDAE